MNTFKGVLEEHGLKHGALKRKGVDTLQVNMGDLCNQNCLHCHIEASPAGTRIMQKDVIDDILQFLRNNKIATLDITGGAPELNPGFVYLVESARPLVDELVVRSNVTVMFEKGMEYLPEFFKKNRVHLVCSLPCYTEENVDRQRGADVFKKSISGLNLLNEAGFGRAPELRLDLVYNALGAYLPGDQDSLEKDYKQALEANYGIHFSSLLTITNVPVKKFKTMLDSTGEYGRYMRLLESSFNLKTLDSLMCRTFLSVGYDGRLYDCDFNLASGLALKDAEGGYLTIGDLRLQVLEGMAIIIGDHCLACTAGSGSSCRGALTNEKYGVRAYRKSTKKKLCVNITEKSLKAAGTLKRARAVQSNLSPNP